jgi:peptidyl-prolyl cis-trans isomerase SurA
MDPHAHCRPAGIAALALSLILSGAACDPAVGQSAKPAKGKQAVVTAAEPSAAGEEHPVKGGQAIVILVNDEPVTAYEIEERALLISLSSGTHENMRAKLEARWAQIIKDPKTNEGFQQLLRQRNVQSKEEAMALQKQYISNLQKKMLEQVQHESRASRLPQFRKEAQEELIDEHLKLQEAKRLGIDVGDEDAKRAIKDIAARNKMTEEQFAQQVKSQGLDIQTMRDRFKAQGAWREVVRRRFSAQIAITQSEVDRQLSATARENGEDGVELEVQKITLIMPGGGDQALMAKRFIDAEALGRKYAGCKSMGELAKRTQDARLDELKFIKPSSVPEPTRSLLLNAKDGDLLPPATTPAGIEMYAVCGRRALKVDEKQREKAQNDLAQHEFEIMAKRLLRDLRQDAHIEYR